MNILTMNRGGVLTDHEYDDLQTWEDIRAIEQTAQFTVQNVNDDIARRKAIDPKNAEVNWLWGWKEEPWPEGEPKPIPPTAAETIKMQLAQLDSIVLRRDEELYAATPGFVPYATIADAIAQKQKLRAQLAKL